MKSTELLEYRIEKVAEMSAENQQAISLLEASLWNFINGGGPRAIIAMGLVTARLAVDQESGKEIQALS